MEKENWITIGKVGVDSGTLMIGDPCYLTGSKWSNKKYNKYISGELCKPGKKFIEIEDGMSVAFESGFGDGVYEVKALIKDYNTWGKRIKEVRIILIEDE